MWCHKPRQVAAPVLNRIRKAGGWSGSLPETKFPFGPRPKTWLSLFELWQSRYLQPDLVFLVFSKYRGESITVLLCNSLDQGTRYQNLLEQTKWNWAQTVCMLHYLEMIMLGLSCREYKGEAFSLPSKDISSSIYIKPRTPMEVWGWLLEGRDTRTAIIRWWITYCEERRNSEIRVECDW